ncbi:MAG: hypothetical protein AAF648_10470 [Pseudomonadota bacterium]
MSSLKLTPKEVTESTLPAASTEGSTAQRLNSQIGLNRSFQELRSHIIQSDERGLPRFGVLSILARRVPFHLYDHPALCALCDTAFTDGIHVFVSTAFFQQVMAEDAQRGKDGERYQSMTLILLHELSHILFRHHARLPRSAPPMLWAVACDIAINLRLLAAYPRLIPGPVFDNAWGVRRDEQARYDGVGEEQILFELWDAPAEAAEPLVSQLKSALDAGENPALSTDERGSAQGVHDHLQSIERVARSLDEHGLSHVREALQLPDPDDRGGFEQLRARFELQLVNDLDQASELREAHPAGDAMAGGHLERCVDEWVEFERNGRIDWRQLLTELIIGSDMRYEHSDELPSDIYFVEPESMQLEAPLYLGSLLPAAPAGVVLCIIDSSTSVSGDLLALFLGELSALIEHESIQEGRLFITAADTTFRGDLQCFSPQDRSALPERMRVHGRGGTDIAGVINESLIWVQEQDNFDPADFQTLIYFSDLLDHAPTPERLPEHLPQMLFITPPSAQAQRFRRQVAGIAEVAEIRDGTVVELCRS